MLARQARRRWHSWWWVFGALIALPAVVLAALGASAIRATRSERQTRLQEQQRQIARLADAALATALDRAVTDARARTQGAAPVGEEDGLGTYFEVDAQGTVSFPADRVYVGSTQSLPRANDGPALPPEAQNLVAQARSAETQGRMDEAMDAYRRLRAFAEVREWADTQVLALELDAEPRRVLPRVAAPALASSEARAPSGIPLAIIVSSMNEHQSGAARRQFIPLLQATLGSLRAGRWWLRLEQRRVYDAELRRWLRESAADPPGPDERLDHLGSLAATIAETLAQPDRRPAVRAQVVENASTRTLLIWDRPRHLAPLWSGVAVRDIAGTRLFGEALQPVVRGQPFDVALHDERAVLWGIPDRPLPQEFTLMSVPEWTLTLADNSPRPGPLTRLRDQAIVVVPLLVLACGLLMTVWIVRREIALSRLQANFLAAVSHEFKSPITGIRLLMERIRSGRVGGADALERYQTAVAAELARLEGLVNRLLDAQALQSGQKRYTRRLTDIAAVVNDVVTRVQPQADARQITLSSLPAADLPVLRLDATAIADAVRNLLDNAIKYSPDGAKVDLTITAARGHVEIAVADEGIGVDSAEAPRLFDAFYRGRRGEGANVHGTGLGLALVKATAEAHGGTVHVTSDGARGSCFTLALPFSTGEPGALDGKA